MTVFADQNSCSVVARVQFSTITKAAVVYALDLREYDSIKASISLTTYSFCFIWCAGNEAHGVVMRLIKPEFKLQTHIPELLLILGIGKGVSLTGTKEASKLHICCSSTIPGVYCDSKVFIKYILCRMHVVIAVNEECQPLPLLQKLIVDRLGEVYDIPEKVELYNAVNGGCK
ncbi:hypothetical protein QVD17_08412 [Tagetes erecta]|uniref:Uncharacterized protein n=1 Tax=Tagetes erecta TaxID=13708 RepID=A0AAD8NXL2_TARER|nr:hypothetical protein QVD17_08412 [Tagetes erecta]